MSRLVFATALVIATIAIAVPRLGSDEGARLHDIFDDYDRWRLSEYPEEAMSRGDYSSADSVTNQTIEAIAARARTTASFLDRINDIDERALDDDDSINIALFRSMLEHSLGEHEHRTFLAPFGVLSGPLRSIPQMAERIRFQTESDYELYLARLRRVPTQIDAYIERMRLGLEEGRTPPRVTLAGVPAQFAALLGRGGLDALAGPFARRPAAVRADVHERLATQFEEEIRPIVHEALTTFRDFVIDEYIPGCRETLAAIDWPNGEAFYAFRLKVMTTTDMTAQEIHELGLYEVDRIRREMIQVIRSSDFMELHPGAHDLDDDAIFDRFIEYLRTDPRFYHETPEALLAEYRDICKRIDSWMPSLFGHLPRLPYGVRPVPRYAAPSTTTAYYSAGDIRNGEPGWFYANTYDLEQRPRYEMVALALHEAVPGHHHQSAIAQELEDVPEFRKDFWITAFGEGWALYAERLGMQMGLYDSPYDDFGRLTYEMWRACRLVVDPGIHALGWSREQAIEFMRRNSALSELNIETEVDRYIAWPGQACGYKIGELKIRELRVEAEEALGNGFDQRAFHDLVLGAGSIPLDLLEERVRAWIVRRKAMGAYD